MKSLNRISPSLLPVTMCLVASFGCSASEHDASSRDDGATSTVLDMSRPEMDPMDMAALVTDDLGSDPTPDVTSDSGVADQGEDSSAHVPSLDCADSSAFLTFTPADFTVRSGTVEQVLEHDVLSATQDADLDAVLVLPEDLEPLHYDLEIFHHDEADGPAEMMVLVNGVVIKTLQLDEDPDGDRGPTSDNLVVKRLSVALAPGDELGIKVRRVNGESGRIRSVTVRCADRQPVIDPDLPERLAMTFDADTLVDGTLGLWDQEAVSGYATQSHKAYMHGGFGMESAECGLDGEIIKVTNLNDDGPGSFRDAVERSGKRTVVFEVSGSIHLERDINVEDPYLTIAGQTAPAPGIALYHRTFSIRTHDVCVQHIRVRRGDRSHTGSRYLKAQKEDGIQIRANSEPGPYNVILDNVSVSWGNDENVNLSGVSSHDITVRDSLIAEPLHDTSSERDFKGYCMLSSSYSYEPRRVSILSNVFSHCLRRNPRMDQGTVLVANNLIYNPGQWAISVGNDGSMPKDLWGSYVANAIMPFPLDLDDRYTEAVSSQNQYKCVVGNNFKKDPISDLSVFISGNDADEWERETCAVGSATQQFTMLPHTPVWHPSVYVMTAEAARSEVLANAGAFPRFRDVTDERIIEDIIMRKGTLKGDVAQGVSSYISSQDDIGGYPELPQHTRQLDLPSDPQGDEDGDGISNLVEWLQFYTEQVE